VIEVIFSLALGTLAPFPDPVLEPIPVKPEDCVKGILIPTPKPAQPQHKATLIKTVPKKGTRLPKKGIFTPKPIVEDDCASVLPPPPVFTLIPEEPSEYTPIPEVPLAALPPFDVPLWPVPDEPEQPTPFYAGGFGPWPAPRYSGPVPGTYATPGAFVPGVPEPGTWVLLAGGLVLVGWRLKA
jgi:hypothetical protein